MNRSLVFVGALALVAAQPAVTLGAPPGGLVPARPAAPLPHAAARGGSATGGSADRDDFKVPFHVDVQLKPLTVPEHFTLQPRQSTLGHIWYPALYAPACYASNNFLGSPSEQLPADVTLGSLVDGKSNLLSSPSYNAGFAAGNDPGAASSSPLTFQAGFYPTACGAPSFTNF